MYTMPQLKAAAAQIVEQYKTTEEEARHIIGQYNRTNNAALADVVAGDLSSVPQVAQQIGVIIQGRTEPSRSGKAPSRKTKEIGAQESKKTTNRKKITAPEPAEIAQPAELETVQGEIIENYGDLPAGLTEDIEDYLEEFKTKYNLDLEKCSGTQWRAACIYIGQRLQKSGVLLDREKLKRQGGSKIYNPHLIAALIPFWEYLTSLYRHVPLHGDFISFVGVSNEWFYDTERRLTSSQVEIGKKLREIEERAMSAAIADHRENPTGRIYYTKARLGWRESVEIVHTTAASVGTLDDIPKLSNNDA